ncbi:peptide ligase PGM1-related protein [Synechocystis sp. LKSZ1]|uniref:peptide ligase PGM1-related protein n=1 Tax=Synechocystis sp. LKSZ1 TaxID=3144951 RepID=UPI00336BE3D3
MISSTPSLSPEQWESFHQLQHQLRGPAHSEAFLDKEGGDILVLPSFSLDQSVGEKIPGFLHYEERLLFSLIRLRNPKTRLIYVTAQPLSPLIVEYYLQLLAGIPFSHARERLLLFTAYDNAYKPLTQKILERPRLIERIRQALRPGRSHIVCFNATALEAELSLQLQTPLLAASPALAYWGSKSGSREIFAEAGVSYPDGSFLVNSVEALLAETVALWQRQPHLRRVMVKLNEGFSGEGNAIFPLPTDRTAQAASPELLQAYLPCLQCQAQGETWESFLARIPSLGAIVEAFVEGAEKRSPSVQGYISPQGEVSILSTHDQILGGPDQQIYLGCRFPADDGYRLALQNLGLKIGQVLAQRGAMERFGVDFMAVRQGETWELTAIEINLRKGGTTHPFMTLKLLTNGIYDPTTGLFYSQEGQPRYYLASDNLQKPQYHGLLPDDLMDIIATHGLHYNSTTQTGTLFHLMGALSEFGKLGLTCIGRSPAEAEAIYQKVEHCLDQETADP